MTDSVSAYNSELNGYKNVSICKTFLYQFYSEIYAYSKSVTISRLLHYFVRYRPWKFGQNPKNAVFWSRFTMVTVFFWVWYYVYIVMLLSLPQKLTWTWDESIGRKKGFFHSLGFCIGTTSILMTYDDIV